MRGVGDKFDTHRSRESMCDTGEFLKPDTIADQLRNQGGTRLNMRTDPAGNAEPVPITYPPAGNAGFDNDHDADDYNWAAQQGMDGTTSSAGPY